MLVVKKDDIDINIKLRFKKEFHKANNLTKEDIIEFIVVIKELIYDLFETFINIRKDEDKKIDIDSKRMFV